jgi:hypothetical protein
MGKDDKSFAAEDSQMAMTVIEVVGSDHIK